MVIILKYFLMAIISSLQSDLLIWVMKGYQHEEALKKNSKTFIITEEEVGTAVVQDVASWTRDLRRDLSLFFAALQRCSVSFARQSESWPALLDEK